MKKFILNIILTLSAFNSIASGPEYYNTIKLDILSLMSTEPRLLRVYMERGLGTKYSICFSGEFGKYFGKNQRLSEEDVIEYGADKAMFYSITGLGAMTEFRYYPFRRYVDAPLGTFVGGHFRARSVKESYDPTFQNITTFGYIFDLGSHVGYKLNSKQITLELVLGLGYPYASFISPNRREEIPVMFTEDLNEFSSYLRMEMSIGYIFPKLQMKKRKRDYVIG